MLYIFVVFVSILLIFSDTFKIRGGTLSRQKSNQIVFCQGVGRDLLPPFVSKGVREALLVVREFFLGLGALLL